MAKSVFLGENSVGGYAYTGTIIIGLEKSFDNLLTHSFIIS